MFCSHHWREINIKISRSLCSLGTRCKVYIDKSSSCSITDIEELAKEIKHQTIDHKEES